MKKVIFSVIFALVVSMGSTVSFAYSANEVASELVKDKDKEKKRRKKKKDCCAKKSGEEKKSCCAEKAEKKAEAGEAEKKGCQGHTH